MNSNGLVTFYTWKSWFWLSCLCLPRVPPYNCYSLLCWAPGAVCWAAKWKNASEFYTISTPAKLLDYCDRKYLGNKLSSAKITGHEGTRQNCGQRKMVASELSCYENVFPETLPKMTCKNTVCFMDLLVSELAFSVISCFLFSISQQGYLFVCLVMLLSFISRFVMQAACFTRL